MWDSADWRGVVFVSDRSAASLRRRERCLELAGITSSIVTERRPSGTYYKLCVREEDTVDAHLALQLGGFCRSVKLRRNNRGVTDVIEDLASGAWEEFLALLDRVAELVRTAPRLLLGRTEPVTD